MVKYVELNIGENQRFEDEYGNFFVVKRDEMGYYICDDTAYVYGPYEIVIADLQIKDVFACGLNGKAFEFFNVGIDGLVSKEHSEISMALKRELKELQIREELAFFPDCKFVGEVDFYRLEKIPNGPFAKKDGYTRIWLEGKFRHIFITKEGKYFAVNPNKELKELGNYLKFDSFEELTMHANSKGFDYSPLAHPKNKYLARLYHVLKFNKAIPNRYIKKIFDALKEKFGLKEFQNLKEEVKNKLEKHQLVDLEGVYKILLEKDLEELTEYFKKNNPRHSNNKLPSCGVQEIQGVIDSHSSSLSYRQINVTYAGEKISVLLSNDDGLESKIKNKNLYDWQGINVSTAENQGLIKEICQLENKRIEQALYKSCLHWRDFLIDDDSESEND